MRGPIAWRFTALGGLTAGLAGSPWLGGTAGSAGFAAGLLALALLALLRPGPAVRAPVALAWLGVVGAVALALGLGLGWARLAAIDGGALYLEQGREVRVRGYLTAVPDRFEGRAALRLQTPAGRLAVEVREPVPRLAVGQLVAARGRVREAREWEAGRLRRLGIATVLNASSLRPLEVRRGGLAGTLDAVRSRAERALGQGTSAGAASLLRGFVLGEDDLIAPALGERFKRSGLSHLLRRSVSDRTSRSRRWFQRRRPPTDYSSRTLGRRSPVRGASGPPARLRTAEGEMERKLGLPKGGRVSNYGEPM